MKSTKWKRSSKQNEKQPLITDIFLDLFIVHNFLTDSYVGKSPINYSHLLGNIFLLVRTFFRQASKSRQVNPRRFFFRWNCKVHVKQQVIGAVHWNFCIRWKWKRFHPTYGVSIRQCEVVKKKSGKKPSCCLTCLESLIWKTLAKGKKDGMCGHHTIRDTHKHKHTNTPWLVGNKSPKRKKVVASFFQFRQS